MIDDSKEEYVDQYGPFVQIEGSVWYTTDEYLSSFTCWLWYGDTLFTNARIGMSHSPPASIREPPDTSMIYHYLPIKYVERCSFLVVIFV